MTYEPGSAEAPREPERLCPHGYGPDDWCDDCMVECSHCGCAVEKSSALSLVSGPLSDWYCNQSCADNHNEAAEQRRYEDAHDGGGTPTMRERQLKEWGERR